MTLESSFHDAVVWAGAPFLLLVWDPAQTATNPIKSVATNRPSRSDERPKGVVNVRVTNETMRTACRQFK